MKTSRTNFIRAESDADMAGQFKDGAFGTFKHTREVVPIDRQLIVRLNRDTIYSSGPVGRTGRALTRAAAAQSAGDQAA